MPRDLHNFPALPADVRSEPTLREFAEWVGRQDARTEYCYGDNGLCAFALFLAATGRATRPRVGGITWHDRATGEPWGAHCIPDAIIDTLPDYPRTFGALASRLEALSESPAS